MIDNSSFKTKYYLGIVAAIFAPVIFIGVIIYPLFLGIVNFSAQSLGAKEELKALDFKRGFIKDFERDLEEKQADLPKIDNSFLSEGGLVGFIKEVERFALENNLNAEIKNISEVNKSGSQSFILVQVSALGPYPDFLKFIRMIENSAAYAFIDSLQITSSFYRDLTKNNSIEMNDISANLILKIYLGS